MWSVTCAKTPLFTVFLYIGKQKPLQIARFLKFTGSKTALLFTVCLQCFLLCEAETIANSDVFEMAVAQNTAMYNAQQRRQRPSPKEPLNRQNCLPGLPKIDTSKKNMSQNRKSKTTRQKTQVLFTLVLPVPSGRTHEHVNSVL